jgi:hypothetical protein
MTWLCAPVQAAHLAKNPAYKNQSRQVATQSLAYSYDHSSLEVLIHVYTYTFIRTYTQMYLYIYFKAYMYIFACAYMYTYMHT